MDVGGSGAEALKKSYSNTQGHRENTEAPGQRKKMRPLRAKRAENFQHLQFSASTFLVEQSPKDAFQ